jgi:uncharacterized protein
MGAQENIDLVRRGYAAFSSGDIETLQALFAEDAVWNAVGSGEMSGPKIGRDGILTYFGELVEDTGGTFSVSLIDLAGGDGRVFALHRIHGERDGKIFDEDEVNIFVIGDGVVDAVTSFSNDTSKEDEFWA